MVAFEQFVRPALLRMMGHRDLFRPVVRARLCETLRQKPGRTTFVRARVTRERDGLAARPTGSQSSGVLLSMVRANGLIVFPADRAELPEGSEAEVQIIDAAFWQVPEPAA
jgi:molybdopterin molybdotransferase